MVVTDIEHRQGNELSQAVRHCGMSKALGEYRETFVHEDIDELRNYADSDDEAETSSTEESEMSDTGIDPLLGMAVTTKFGIGTIENIQEFELRQYFTIRLNTCGTVNMVSQAVVDLLKKQKRYAPPQPVVSRRERLQNLKGYIRMYNPAKGWGFLVCDEFEGDIFLHSKHMIAPAPREYIGHFQSSQEGHTVRFDLDLQHRNRPQALNVRVIGVTEQEVIVYPKRRKYLSKGENTTEHANAEDTFDDSDDTSRNEVPVEDVIAEGRTLGAHKPSEVVGQLDETVPPPIVENLQTVSGASPAHGDGYQLSLDSHLLQPGANDFISSHKGVLRMRGLPFTARAEDIADFFKGYGVRAEDVTMGQRPDGSASGEALVLFARDELAEKARKEKHMQHMGHRYIELFNAKTSNGEAPMMGPRGTFPSHQEMSEQISNINPANLSNNVAIPMPPGAAPQAVAYAAYAAALHAAQAQGLPSMTVPQGSPTLPGLHGEVESLLPPPETISTDQSWEQQLYQQYFEYFQQTYAATAASQAIQVVQALHAAESSKQQPENIQPHQQTQPTEMSTNFQQPYPSAPPAVNEAVARAPELKYDYGTGSAPSLGEANKTSSWQQPPVGSPHLLEYFDGTKTHFYNEI